jgi:hypothetical protein
MNFRILVAGESDEADFALFLRFLERLGGAIFSDEEVRIVIESHPVDLPEVKMIGLQAAQGFFEHLQGEGSVTTVRAGFRHQKNFVAAAFETGSHPDFGFSAAILPAIVVEGNASIDGLMNDLDRSFLVRSLAKMMASEAEGGNLNIGAAKLS